MNKTALKRYAMRARMALIGSCIQKAYEYQITEHGENDPDITQLNGIALTTAEQQQRCQLIGKIEENGFADVMEQAAYTWFNRFIALRYMEVNGYLPSRVRVFTDEDGRFKPEILREAHTVNIPGIDREHVLLLLETQNTDALYKYLILMQCRALHEELPAMFEEHEGWTELLFPANQLREGSVIHRLVTDIPETDWHDQVQIVGWLYQYYNTEPKDRISASMKQNIKVSREQIPAATQLFTPDWIVRYMVENSLGRLWLEAHPGSSVRGQFRYYLEDVQQDAEVQEILASQCVGLRSLKPEEITFFDPCMGSGHILVYAFEVLMQIYVSCGWSEREAAVSIVKHNLYGLDLDKRAYQLSCFAVMMKARQYDRHFLTRGIQPNLSHFQELPHPDEIPQYRELAEKFRDADMYGSLLTAEMYACDVMPEQHQAAHLVKLCRILSKQYDVVCTNPPYMGASGMNDGLSDFVKKHYPDSKLDLFACFIERCAMLTKPQGFYSMITMQSWMFLSSFKRLREKLNEKTLVNMLHLGARAFDEIGGEVVQTSAFVYRNSHIKGFSGTYVRLTGVSGEAAKETLFLSGQNRYTAAQEQFRKLPGVPVAYWVSEAFLHVFERGILLRTIAAVRQGMATGNNQRFVRAWYETDIRKIMFHAADRAAALHSGKKWFPYNKGGSYRKWYGNEMYVVNWEHDGEELRTFKKSLLRNQDRYFRQCITWSKVSGGPISFRYKQPGHLFDVAGTSIFADELPVLLALCNSRVVSYIIGLLSPTLNYEVGQVADIPVLSAGIHQAHIAQIANENIMLCRQDWDSFETSHDFLRHPLI